jgi:hypothetical protein
MSLVYDYDASGMDDPIVAQVERATNIAIEEMRPEVTAVIAAFPLCKCPMSALPSGFNNLIDYSPMCHLHVTSEAPSRVVPRGGLQTQRYDFSKVYPGMGRRTFRICKEEHG